MPQVQTVRLANSGVRLSPNALSPSSLSAVRRPATARSTSYARPSVLGHVDAIVDHLFHGGEAVALWTQLLAYDHSLVEQRLILDHIVDQPPLQRLLRA